MQRMLFNIHLISKAVLCSSFLRNFNIKPNYQPGCKKYVFSESIQTCFSADHCCGSFSGFAYCPAEKKLHTVLSIKKITIGQMQVQQRIAGDDVFFSIESNVEIRILLSIRIRLLENVHYYKGNLIASTSKRYINEKLKANRETKINGDYYVLTGAKDERLNQKQITYNFAMLYYKEPVGMKSIYSDYYQKILNILSPSQHVYTINLPEGGSNTYYYTNGVCNKVNLHSTLFEAQMVLNH